MALTYVKIASVTVGAGGAADITFSSIPATYDDLIIQVSARSSRTGTVDLVLVNFNNLSTNLSERELFGTGSVALSSSNTLGRTAAVPTSSNTSNTFGNASIYIPNYAGSTNKSFSSDSVQENNGTDSYQAFTANLWSSTSAITSIKLLLQVGPNFTQYSTAVLYGIKRT